MSYLILPGAPAALLFKRGYPELDQLSRLSGPDRVLDPSRD
jgi:hypothetical protein